MTVAISLRVSCLAALSWLAVAASAAEPETLRARTLAEAVATARAGDVIVLPAGTYRGGLVLPPGVSLRGAGFARTIIDAQKAEVGLTIRGGRKAELSDLTVRGAIRTNILVESTDSVALRRVRATASLNGISVSEVSGGRIENAICDDNRYGIILSGGRDNAVVNCTLVRNASLGLSIPSGQGARVFNNCINESATAVYLGDSLTGLTLDHNLYFALFIGKIAGQAGRKSIGPWRTLSGQDAHSVQLPVRFLKNQFQADPSTDGALGRASTSEWGIAALGGVNAPERDILGNPRSGRPDVGAFEVDRAPARPPDTTIAVRSDEGLKSAGLFAAGGREVAYLFHDLPLPQGSYPIWFPERDYEGRPIAAGTYELKTVASALRWEYLNWVGDTGAAAPPGKTAAVSPGQVAFDGQGHLVLGTGWSEDGTNLRGYDAATGRWLWSFGGHSDMHGLTLGGDGAIYALKPSDKKGLITRVDPATGKIAPWESLNSGTTLFDDGASANGLAELDGTLFVTDSASGEIRHGPTNAPSFANRIKGPRPSSPAADPKTHRLWVIVDGRAIRALDKDGKVLAEVTPVAAPAALAARDGLLAVASRATGKVHLFDARDLKKLVARREIGTGDGPYGPYRPDRFLFQSSPIDPGSYVHLALGPKGELAVAEENRLLVFDAEGKSLWSTFGEFGDFDSLSLADSRRLFEANGRKSLRLDDASGTWAPEAFWGVSIRGEFLGDFRDGGQTFGAFLERRRDLAETNLIVTRTEGTTLRPVLRIEHDFKTNQYLTRKDTNRDGRIDDRDPARPMPAPSGEHPLRNGDMFHVVFTILQPNGDLLALATHPATWGTLWRRNGLDADGVPVYRLQDCRAFPRPKPDPISPYTRAPGPAGALTAGTLDDRGNLTAVVNTPTAPGGTGLFNNAGTDVIQLDPGGRRLWFRPLSVHKGIEGLATVGPVSVVSAGLTAEIIAMNRDGLGLGSFGFPAEVHYNGYFLDHPQAVRAYRGRDGKMYLLVADNYNGRQHWWRLLGEETIATATRPVALSESTARTLASLPDAPKSIDPRPATPLVRVPRLDRDLPIDGDPAKWREAGIAPQILITPETATGAIDGPRDVSAVVRLAYRGKSIYVQMLTFDDVPTFHQPVARHYQQDSVELCINGFGEGFKFDVARTTDAGTILIRQRFFFQNLEALLSPEQAPRVVKVLPNARDVPERALIESVYGLDMAASPVIVTEFKLPIDETTYKGALNALFPMQPGQTFRIGFLINDNDEPGTDNQNYLVWPPTYSNFGPLEDSAIAVLE